jgi:hypothetical protein
MEVAPLRVEAAPHDLLADLRRGAVIAPIAAGLTRQPDADQTEPAAQRYSMDAHASGNWQS